MNSMVRRKFDSATTVCKYIKGLVNNAIQPLPVKKNIVTSSRKLFKLLRKGFTTILAQLLSAHDHTFMEFYFFEQTNLV